MKIAIVGAGFCGLASAWYLAKAGHAVTVFDEKGIGAGASGIAAGIIHPYGGAKATLNWNAPAGLQESFTLFDIAAKALGKPVIMSTGMFRPAFTPQQQSNFSLAAANYSDVTWRDCEYTHQQLPGLSPLEGIFIASAATIDTKNYLAGLWIACQQNGASLEIVKIYSRDELAGFDRVIYAVGASTSWLEPLIPRITPIKGQLLALAWTDKEPLPCALNSSHYLVMDGPQRCIAGSTFERKWQQEGVDLSVCEAPIRQSIGQFCPSFSSLELIECRTGIRATTANKRPCLHAISDSQWYIGGMGAKGLLYHALFAKELTRQMFPG